MYPQLPFILSTQSSGRLSFSLTAVTSAIKIWTSGGYFKNKEGIAAWWSAARLGRICYNRHSSSLKQPCWGLFVLKAFCNCIYTTQEPLSTSICWNPASFLMPLHIKELVTTAPLGQMNNPRQGEFKGGSAIPRWGLETAIPSPLAWGFTGTLFQSPDMVRNMVHAALRRYHLRCSCFLPFSMAATVTAFLFQSPTQHTESLSLTKLPIRIKTEVVRQQIFEILKNPTSTGFWELKIQDFRP